MQLEFNKLWKKQLSLLGKEEIFFITETILEYKFCEDFFTDGIITSYGIIAQFKIVVK